MAYHVERRAQLANGLKSARRNSGLSAQTAASLLATHGIRCSRGTLLAWERGQGKTSREPFASDLHAIASIYGCTVDDLFSRRSEPAPT